MKVRVDWNLVQLPFFCYTFFFTDSDFNEPTWHDIEDKDGEDEQKFDMCSESSVFNVDTAQIKTPLDAFKLFVRDELLNYIIESTNKFAQESTFGAKSQWTDIDLKELSQFMSVVLVMGLNQLPSINFYWSKDPMFKNEFITTTMRRDRFLIILRYVYFCNNEEPVLDTTDKLYYKIGKPLEMLNEQFKLILTPGRILVIDDSIIPFKGRFTMRQYIPNIYGIKMYKLCTEDGYTNNIAVYTGKNMQVLEQNHSTTIVYELLESIENKEGHYLIADNFYSDLSLAKELFDQKILYCGTLRPNHKRIPLDFERKMKKGEIFGKQNDCVKIIKWMDKRPVLMLTTDPTHKGTLEDTEKGDIIAKPQCVIQYNEAKNGIDYSNQSYNSVLHKALKWYQKLMFELLFGTCVVNSWIIFNKLLAKKMSITQFRKTLAVQLADTSKTDNESFTQKRTLHTVIKPSGTGRNKRKASKGLTPYSKKP